MASRKNQHGWHKDKNSLVHSNKNWEKNAQTLKKEWSSSSGFLWRAYFCVYDETNEMRMICMSTSMCVCMYMHVNVCK